jgi:hypothetical protein
MKFHAGWHTTTYGVMHPVGKFYTWNDARNFLPVIDTGGMCQYYASIDDGHRIYRFLVTKGAGPLEVIAMQSYPNLSIDDVLLKQ